jgi:hypothetical protein
MSKFTCRCENVISDVSCPSTHQGHFVTDLDIDNAICAGREGILDIPHREIFECPECKRLWVQQSPRVGKYLPFLPESEPLNLAEQQGGYRG